MTGVLQKIRCGIVGIVLLLGVVTAVPVTAETSAPISQAQQMEGSQPVVAASAPVRQFRPQFKRDDAPSGGQMFAPYVLIVLCLIAGCLWWGLRRKKQLGVLLPTIESSPLKIIKHQRLSGKTMLHIVQYRGQELLLAEHANGVKVLHRIELGSVNAAISAPVNTDVATSADQSDENVLDMESSKE